jgi:hypothetical protein
VCDGSRGGRHLPSDQRREGKARRCVEDEQEPERALGQQAAGHSGDGHAQVDDPVDQRERTGPMLGSHQIGDHRRHGRPVQVDGQPGERGGDRDQGQVADDRQHHEAGCRRHHADDERRPASHPVGEVATERLRGESARTQAGEYDADD